MIVKKPAVLPLIHNPGELSCDNVFLKGPHPSPNIKGLKFPVLVSYLCNKKGESGYFPHKMFTEDELLHRYWNEPIWEGIFNEIHGDGIILKDVFDKYGKYTTLCDIPLIVFINANRIQCSVAPGYDIRYISVAHKLMQKLGALLKRKQYHIYRNDADSGSWVTESWVVPPLMP